MTNDELIRQALPKTALANQQLVQIYVHGQARPVPPEFLTAVLVNLREATAAVTELERRARGGAAPLVG
jgi:hypothetical protein